MPAGRHGCEYAFDFIPFQEESLGRLCPLLWNRHHLLRLGEAIWQLPTKVFKEGPQCRQPLITRSNTIGTCFFEGTQESTHQSRRKVVEREPRDLALEIFGGKLEKEPHSVPITSNGMGAQPLLDF